MGREVVPCERFDLEYEERGKLLDRATVPGGCLKLLAGHSDLTLFEEMLAACYRTRGATDTRALSALDTVIKKTAKAHDINFVLIDTSPSKSALNKHLFCMSDYLIMPRIPDYFSYEACRSLSTILPLWLEETRNLRRWAEERGAPALLKRIAPDMREPIYGVPKLLGVVFSRVSFNVQRVRLTEKQPGPAAPDAEGDAVLPVAAPPAEPQPATGAPAPEEAPRGQETVQRRKVVENEQYWIDQIEKYLNSEFKTTLEDISLPKVREEGREVMSMFLSKSVGDQGYILGIVPAPGQTITLSQRYCVPIEALTDKHLTRYNDQFGKLERMIGNEKQACGNQVKNMSDALQQIATGIIVSTTPEKDEPPPKRARTSPSA